MVDVDVDGGVQQVKEKGEQYVQSINTNSQPASIKRTEVNLDDVIIVRRDRSFRSLQLQALAPSLPHPSTTIYPALHRFPFPAVTYIQHKHTTNLALHAHLTEPLFLPCAHRL